MRASQNHQNHQNSQDHQDHHQTNPSHFRCWITHILGSWWLRYILTTVIYLGLVYGIARSGHELDTRRIWRWKQSVLALIGRNDPPPVVPILNVDWIDVVWGVVMLASAGTLTLILALFSASWSCSWKSCRSYTSSPPTSDNPIRVLGRNLAALICFPMVVALFG